MPPTVRVTTFDLSNVTEGFVKALEAYAAFVTAGAAPSTQQKTEAAWARQMFNRMGLTTLPKDFVGANEAKGLREIANEVMKARSYLAQKGYLTGLNAALQDPVAKADLEARDKDLRAVVTEASSAVPRIDGPKQAWRFLKKAFGLNDVMPPNMTAIWNPTSHPRSSPVFRSPLPRCETGWPRNRRLRWSRAKSRSTTRLSSGRRKRRRRTITSTIPFSRSWKPPP